MKFDPKAQEQSFQVPACATTLFVQAYGASGGDAYNASPPNPTGGRGALVEASLNVATLGLAGETLYAYVGGIGENGDATSGGLGGWNGGGDGGFRSGTTNGVPWVGAAGGGGGATDLRRGGHDLNHRMIVAAGGGGAGGACTDPDGVLPRPGGGDGGIGYGDPGDLCFSYSGSGGGGANLVHGGTEGVLSGFCTANPGASGLGGAGCDEGGGGGGGGYFGGGGGAWGGGGGGSSFVASGVSLITSTAGNRAGAGLLIITWS